MSDLSPADRDVYLAEIARLNKVIARMQYAMSSQAEQWSKSMAEAQERGYQLAQNEFYQPPY